jgi:hypothetical protein
LIVLATARVLRFDDRDLCQRVEGNDWQQIAEQLSRVGHWEVEDCREFKD